MGTFLSTQLWVSVKLEQKKIRDEELDSAQLLGLLKDQLGIWSEIYEEEDSDEYKILKIKPQIIQDELMPFFQHFFGQYYLKTNSLRFQSYLASLQAHTTETWLRHLEEDCVDEIFTMNETYRISWKDKNIYPSIRIWQLTLEGKVLVEEIEGHLSLFRHALKHGFPFQLAKALEVDLI